MLNIGFIGCGNMGKPMALNLVKAGYRLIVYDVKPEAIKELLTSGAIKADSIREVAEKSDTIITVLPSSPEVEQVVPEPQGILSYLKEGSTIIDMSTINPVTTRKLASAAAKKKIGMLDAPVSGGPFKAADGTLTIIVGGSEDVFKKYRGILHVMGENIYYVGEAGMGQVVKLANQLLVAANLVALSESFQFASELGADPKTLYEVITRSSGNSFILEKNVPYPDITLTSAANKDFTPGFTTNMMIKDLNLILSASDKLGMPMSICNFVRQIYEIARAKGLGEKDFSAVSKIIQQIPEV